MSLKAWLGIVLLLSLCLAPALPLRAEDEGCKRIDPVPERFLSWEELLSYFDGNVQVETGQPEASPFRSPEAATGPETASFWGFDEAIRINGVQYFAKYIKNTLVKSNALGVDDVSFLCTVANGQTSSVTETRTTGGTFSISIAGIELLKKIKDIFRGTAGLSVNFTKTKTVTKGTTYSFPSNCAGFNGASFYIGTAYDLYKYTYDIAPVISQAGDRRPCLLECRKLPADEMEACQAQCNMLYPDYPDMSRISRYELHIYVPRPFLWSVCTNGPG